MTSFKSFLWCKVAPVGLIAFCGLGMITSMACTGDIGSADRAEGGEGGDGAEGGDGDGISGGFGGAEGTVAGPAFSCDAKALPAPGGLKKLTEIQLRNTLTDLLKYTLKDDTDVAAVMAEIPSLARLPKDNRAAVPEDLHGSYRRLDQTLTQSHVDAVYDIEGEFGAALAKRERLGKVMGSCANDANTSNDGTCLTDFIKRFGERALRRPLADSEIGFYRAIHDGSTIEPAALADVIAAFLGAPQFLYRMESGQDAVEGKPGVFKLSPHELAARLSYHFWDTMPDDELWSLAKSGHLLEPETYREQVARLAGSPRARETFQRFFTEWLKLEDLKPLDALKDDARFKAFAGPNLPSAGLRQAAMDDVVAMASHFAWDKDNGTLGELLTSDRVFTQNAELAKVYGVDPWDGQGEGVKRDDRPGLLTRVAFLSSPSGNTRPIMKGVFIRKTILCDSIPTPPADAGLTPPMLSTEMTTRQVVEEITQKPGSSCAGCHTTLINPLGFVTEGYDALGRVRSMQTLFDERGAMKRELPIDTRAKPYVDSEDETEIEGPAELADLITQSGKADACMARQYFRFTEARWEDDAADGCTLERLRVASAAKGGSLATMFREVAFTASFLQRRFD